VELEAVTPFNVRTVTLLKTPDATELLASRPEESITPRSKPTATASTKPLPHSPLGLALPST
jgi:hypothetical protein